MNFWFHFPFRNSSTAPARTLWIFAPLAASVLMACIVVPLLLVVSLVDGVLVEVHSP